MLDLQNKYLLTEESIDYKDLWKNYLHMLRGR